MIRFKPILLSGIFLFSFTFLLFSEEPTDLSWLQLDAPRLENWKYEVIDGDIPGRLYSPLSTERTDFKIIVLCAKKSSSYQLAFNKFLEVMEQKLPSVEAYVFNCSKDEPVALKVFQYARRIKADLLLSMGSEAMLFANKHLKGDDIPVVTCINKDPVLLDLVEDYKSGSKTNMAFTSVNVPTNVNAEWLLKLKPGIKALALLYDPDHSSVVSSEVKPFKAYLEKMGIDVIDCAIPTEAGTDIKEAIKKSMNKAIALMGKSDPDLSESVFWLTSSTNLFSELKTLSKYSGTVPLISSVPNTVNTSSESALMAIGIDRRNSANLASLYVIEILKGNIEPGDLPVGVVTPPDISINFQTAKRIQFKFPFDVFENSSFIYGYDGTILRSFGKNIYP